MSKLWDLIVAFFKSEADSIRGVINFSEFLKVVGSGILGGLSFWAILASVQASLSSIITDPTLLKSVIELVKEIDAKQWVTVAVTLVTIVLDGYRRIQHGQDGIIIPVPDDSKKN